MEQGSWAITNSIDGTTMAFLTMNMAEIFHSVNMRSQRGSIFTLKTRNSVMIFACIAAFLLTAGVIYVPFLSQAFGFADISLTRLPSADGPWPLGNPHCGAREALPAP